MINVLHSKKKKKKKKKKAQKKITFPIVQISMA